MHHQFDHIVSLWATAPGSAHCVPKGESHKSTFKFRPRVSPNLQGYNMQGRYDESLEKSWKLLPMNLRELDKLWLEVDT